MAEISRSQPLLGTFVRITLRDASSGEAALQALADQAFAEVRQVQSLMSWHDPHSDVSRLNAQACRDKVTVHPWTAHVLSEASRFSDLSAGAFDITVTPMLTRWGLRPGRNREAAKAQSGNWRAVIVTGNHEVRFQAPVQIDLGGIAKGHAVDRAVMVLQAAGVDFALVDAGGDMRHAGMGSPPLHLRPPESPFSRPVKAYFLKSSVATSAAYATSRFRGWRWVNHLVNPLTGRPAGRKASATVFADTCLQADALSKIALFAPAETAAFALRHEEAVQWDGRAAPEVPCQHGDPF